jgi:hypothetical protein
MIIPPDQFDQLLQQDEEAFVQRTMAAIGEEHPTARETDDMRRGYVKVGFKRARRHGLTADEDVMAYVLVMYRINPNFDQQPQIAAMLANTALPPAERWDRLFGEAFDDAWFDASDGAFYNGRFWHDPDERPEAGDTEPLTADDWAELVVGLRQAEGPGPYPPATPDELARARDDLVAAMDANAARTPQDWDARAEEVAQRLRDHARPPVK